MSKVKEQEITLNNRTYRMKKFTPKIACYWAYQVLGNMATLKGNNIQEKIKDFATMDKKNFDLFMKDCLSFVDVKMESGYHAVMNSDGFLVIPDIENPDVLQLMTLSFAFTLSDFFDPAQINGLVKATADLFPTIGQTISSSTQSGSSTGSSGSSGTEPTT